MASTSGLFTGYGQPTISIKPLAGDSGDFDQWQNQIQHACPFIHANLLSPDAQTKFDALLVERDTLLAKEGEETMKNQTLINYRESKIKDMIKEDSFLYQLLLKSVKGAAKDIV